MVQRLSQVQGVGQVNVGGSSLPAVRVEVDPTQLNSYGLGLSDISGMLSRQNANLPKGHIADDTTTADITTNDQLMKAVNYQPLVVGYHNGAAIKLSDVADVVDATENIRAAGFVNGQPSVLLIVFRQPGANIIDTVDRVRAALPSLKASIPAAINVSVTLDRTLTIRTSVSDVERSLFISVCLVILVVFVFLRSPRATLIPSVAVPVSLIGTFGIMYLCHYSIDNLSLMALTISTGFVVDDAIVVIENVMRHFERWHAADAGGIARGPGDRLHGALDEPFAGCGIHSDSTDGRHRGSPVPRIRRHTFSGHSGFTRGFAHDDANDVLAAAEAGIPNGSTTYSIARATEASAHCSAPTSAR